MANDLDIYEGEDKTFSVLIKDSAGDPIDITGYTFLFVVKRKLNNPDNSAVIKKIITNHTDPTNGLTQIALTEEDSEGKHGQYVYDYQWIDTSTNRRVVLKKANFEIEQRVGDDFS